jgi:hypothetical protein
MVHNEEELIAGSLKIGASERVLCQGANMLASGVTLALSLYSIYILDMVSC